jgi:hypothetical protein
MLRRATLEGIRETERFEEIAEEAVRIAQQVEADIEPELIRGRERPSEREGG